MLTPRQSKKIAKRYQKTLNKGRLKHVLPVAAGTAGVARAAAKSAEGTLSEQAIFRTRQVAASAENNLQEVLNKTQLGPYQKFKAKRIIKKNIREGMEAGKSFGDAVFNPGKST
jgi:hypothetical protein